MKNSYHQINGWGEVPHLAEKYPELAGLLKACQYRLPTNGEVLPRVTKWASPFNIRFGLNFRSYYNDLYSWPLITLEYRDTLAQLLKGKKVLEVMAGRGYLGHWMAEVGIDWTCTDIAPAAPHVIERGAFVATEHFDHDILFMSWCPYKSEVDHALAQLGKPVMFIGEGPGGCTGSEALWGNYPWETRYDEHEELEPRDPNPYVIREFQELDIPDQLNFSGIHSRTFVTVPDGQELVLGKHRIKGGVTPFR